MREKRRGKFSTLQCKVRNFLHTYKIILIVIALVLVYRAISCMVAETGRVDIIHTEAKGDRLHVIYRYDGEIREALLFRSQLEELTENNDAVIHR